MAAELEAGQFARLVEEAERRWRATAEGDRPWLRIGTALCGKAAGCDEVIDALEARLERQRARATVTQVGCFGLCFAEPLLDVQFPGGPRIFYGNVTPESVEEIVDSHVVSGNPVTHSGHGVPARRGRTWFISPRRSLGPVQSPDEGLGKPHRPAKRRGHRPPRHLPLSGQRRVRGPTESPSRNDSRGNPGCK